MIHEPDPEPPAPRRSLFGRFTDPEPSPPAPSLDDEDEDEPFEPVFSAPFDDDDLDDPGGGVPEFVEEPAPQPAAPRRPRRSWRRSEPAPVAETPEPEGADEEFYDLRDSQPWLYAPDPEALQEFDQDLDQDLDPEPVPVRQRISSRNLPGQPDNQVAFGASGIGGSGRNLMVAAGVGAALFAIALVASALGALVLCLLVAVILLLCAGEYFQAMRQAGYEPVALVGLAAVAAAPLAVYWRPQVGLYVVVVLALLACLTTFVVGAGGQGRVVEACR